MTGVVKRAPKWAWFTVGGVVIAVVAIRVWQNRATDAEAGMEVGTVEGQPTTPGTGSGGLIVPPVIISPPASDPNLGVPQLMDVFLGAITTIGDQYRAIYGPIADMLPGLIPTPDDYIALMGGGGTPTAQPPIVVTVPVPTPQPAPAPAPAPGPAAPPACPSGYPYRSDRGCYKVVCASGSGSVSKGRWHYYSDGDKLKVAATC